MKDCYIKARAYVDWLQLCELVEKREWSFMSLYGVLKGHNLDAHPHSFDCNYRSICATIHEGMYGCYVDKHIEVWNDAKDELVDSCSADELKKYILED